jgi:cytochrome P450
VSLFINRLTNDMALQPENWFYPLFGVKFLNLGLREMDRDINNRIKIYKSWAKEKVNEQVRRAQAKFSADKNQLLEPTNLIDAIMRSIICSNGESVYTEDDIFEEFSTFFVAGVDTSAHFLMMMIYYVSLDKEIERKLRQ